MSRKVIQENFRVEITPKCPRFLREYECTVQEWLDACKEIRDQVLRHIDGLGTVTVTSDYKPVCSHCGAVWTEGEPSEHNGGCCSVDEVVFYRVEGEKENGLQSSL